MPQLLRKGWPENRVRDRYLECAQATVDAGFEFRAFAAEDRPGIEQLLNERITSDAAFVLATEAGGIKATLNGHLAGVIVLEGYEVPGDGIAVRVTAIAVTPTWEGRGLGTVLLGMAPGFTALLENAPGFISEIKFIYGGCAADAAAFYQRAGYDVLQPGEALPFHLGDGLNLKSSNLHYPCWFIHALR